VNYDALLKESPDPDIGEDRLQRLLEDSTARRYLDKLPDKDVPCFLNLITISNFIYRYLCRHPETIATLYGAQTLDISELDSITDLDSLRHFKYKELIKISWLDICQRFSYQIVLDRLSLLAEYIINKTMELVARDLECNGLKNDPVPFTIFALGKLGAVELNFSSDVDLIFISRSEDGFLYRVDLKLRPWGRSGPLIISIDETELYYEASNEAWERFAWLRARIIGGDRKLGEDLLERLQPFIYLRSLGSDDLIRFIKIKNDMSAQRARSGSWNVKLGNGGIRDIEFFIQMLQIVNATSHSDLKTTSTLKLIDLLTTKGFFSREEGGDIYESYIFLRRLENRLQMVDELQTHKLADEPQQRRKIACSLGFGPASDDSTIEKFDRKLLEHREIASSCFDRILPGETS
jgi:glutamate-ammonia-ligase adenylyltransferase